VPIIIYVTSQYQYSTTASYGKKGL